MIMLHATARAVWSIIAGASLINETIAVAGIETTPSPQEKPTNVATQLQKVHVTGGGMDPRLASNDMNNALQQPPGNDVIAYVRSIITSSLHFNTNIPIEEITAFVMSIMATDLNPVCPKFWHHAMKDPVHKGNWVEVMYKHLNSCYAVGTFGRPKIPPSTVTVLPAVIVLKMVINAVKQINAHKSESALMEVTKSRDEILKSLSHILFLVGRSRLVSPSLASYFGVYFTSTFIMLFKPVPTTYPKKNALGFESIKPGWITTESATLWIGQRNKP
jgi:hypothetical protein